MPRGGGSVAESSLSGHVGYCVLILYCRPSGLCLVGMVRHSRAVFDTAVLPRPTDLLSSLFLCTLLESGELAAGRNSCLEV